MCVCVVIVLSFSATEQTEPDLQLETTCNSHNFNWKFNRQRILYKKWMAHFIHAIVTSEIKQPVFRSSPHWLSLLVTSSDLRVGALVRVLSCSLLLGFSCVCSDWYIQWSITQISIFILYTVKKCSSILLKVCITVKNKSISNIFSKYFSHDFCLHPPLVCSIAIALCSPTIYAFVTVLCKVMQRYCRELQLNGSL